MGILAMYFSRLQQIMSPPWGLILGNDTYSTTETDGLTLNVWDSGRSLIRARGTGSTMSLGTGGRTYGPYY